MTTTLRSDGRPIAIGRVSISSPGLRGTADIRPPAEPGTRGSGATSALDAALAATGLLEQRTIVIDDASIDFAALSGDAARSSRTDSPGLTITVPGPGTGMGQVMLATDQDGTRSWILPGAEADDGAATRGSDTRTYSIAATPAGTVPETAGRQRGVVAYVGKKILKVLAFELLKKASEELAGRFVEHWEHEHHPYRLRTFEPGSYSRPDAPSLTTADLTAYQSGPVLLLIHGEMNLSHDGFAQLPPAVVGRLHDRYQGRVLAFDHPTVSATPAANAAWLGQLLPPGGLTVDILAHSRGGLLARTLTEQPDTDRLRTRRLVMAGTPNQGTALADPGKLSRYLDLVTTALDFVPDIPVIEALNITLSVVKQIAVGAYNGLDGLTAMQPGSPCLTGLNKRHTVTAAYYAISSDYEPAPGATLARKVLDRVTSLVLNQAGNDLVVPEAGVHAENGASPFPVPDPLLLRFTQSVDHFSYWGSAVVHDKLDQWLVP